MIRELTVAAVQTVSRPGDLDGSVADHVRLAAESAWRGASLAVFPELSLTGYSRTLTSADAVRPGDPRLAPLQDVADAEGVTVVAGAPVSSDSGLHIAALCFVPASAPVVYTKRHLHAGEEAAFAQGTGGPPIRVRDRTVCLAICAEITHAEHARDAAACGAHVYAASCFITPEGYVHDAGLLEGYARAHRMAVVMANPGAACGGWASAGCSAIWSSGGSLIARGPDEGEAIVVSKLA